MGQNIAQVEDQVLRGRSKLGWTDDCSCTLHRVFVGTRILLVHRDLGPPWFDGVSDINDERSELAHVSSKTLDNGGTALGFEWAADDSNVGEAQARALQS